MINLIIKSQLPDYKNKQLNVVITGSTKGIGKALAKKYYLQGANVIINSRSTQSILSVYNELYDEKKENLLYGIVADISDNSNVNFFVSCCFNKIENIDLWINNAATCTYKRQCFEKFNKTDIDTIIDTNLKGTIYCCHNLLPLMKKGHIINVIGAGSNGLHTNGYSIYGSTKAAIQQFTHTLVKENKNNEIGIHLLSPGMVNTDLIMSNLDEDPKLKKIVSFLCVEPEHAANDIIKKIDKQILNSNKKHVKINIFCIFQKIIKFLKFN